MSYVVRRVVREFSVPASPVCAAQAPVNGEHERPGRVACNCWRRRRQHGGVARQGGVGLRREQRDHAREGGEPLRPSLLFQAGRITAVPRRAAEKRRPSRVCKGGALPRAHLRSPSSSCLVQAEVFEEIATLEFQFEGIPTVPPRKDMEHLAFFCDGCRYRHVNSHPPGSPVLTPSRPASRPAWMKRPAP
jgi:hypothetical protein